MSFESTLKSVMKSREEEFSPLVHARILEKVSRRTHPAFIWALRTVLLCTAAHAVFSGWQLAVGMAETRALDFFKTAIDGISADVSVWPYFSEAFFDFVPQGLASILLGDIALFVAGIIALYEIRRHVLE